MLLAVVILAAGLLTIAASRDGGGPDIPVSAAGQSDAESTLDQGGPVGVAVDDPYQTTTTEATTTSSSTSTSSTSSTSSSSSTSSTSSSSTSSSSTSSTSSTSTSSTSSTSTSSTVPGATTTTLVGGTTTTTQPGATTTTLVGGTTTTTLVGGTTTTTPPGCTVTIELSVETGTAGIRIVVRVHCYPLLGADVRVTFTFNGVPVGSALVTPDTGTALGPPHPLAAVIPAQLLDGVRRLVGAEVAQAASARGTAETSFAIPAAPPGVYPVCALAEGVPPVCTTFRVVAAGGGITGGGITGGRSGVARTGAQLGGLAMVGVGSVLLGRFLRAGSRRRRART